MVRGRINDVELVVAGKIAARLEGLFMASLCERGFQIAKPEVKGVLSGSFRNVSGDVSRGFSVPEDDQM